MSDANNIRNSGTRTADGRFGHGNPGKPLGARHKTSLTVENLLAAKPALIGRGDSRTCGRAAASCSTSTPVGRPAPVGRQARARPAYRARA
jgi:hypothetical protein